MTAGPLGCADRSGFLFAHACDRPPAGACTACGRPICLEHTRMTAAGPTCITCVRGDWRDSADSSSVGASGEAEAPGGHGGAAEAAPAPEGAFGGGGATASWLDRVAESSRQPDDPYFFAGSDPESYYDADDFRAFDVPAAGSAEEADEADGGGADTDTGAS